tara:strand:+ start:13 stop:678 length:666 start_codon:yes stop_codon:yes gene_type:complete
MIIAIDGSAATGKSSVAKVVSEKLGFFHINTGSMYRAVTFGLIESKISVNDNYAITDFINSNNITFDDNNDIILNEINVSNKVHSIEVSSLVSKVSSIFSIRQWMVRLQRDIANHRDCVLEGRDIGTIVFPTAENKFFLVANIKTRAMRRKKEMDSYGEFHSIDEITSNILERDELDSNREFSPLKKATDAFEIDTSDIKIEDVVKIIIDKVKLKNKKEIF